MFDINLTKHLAELSKIQFSDEELQRATKEMTDIIALMDRVKEIDSSLNMPMTSAVEYENLREDCAGESSDTELILSNAKAVEDNAFSVPKVV